MNEQVVYIEVEAHRRADVVRFATVDDSAGVYKNQARHDHHYGC